MTVIDIVKVQDSIILKSHNSELLILEEHVRYLKAVEKITDFDFYFNNKALINRPARKLFLSWSKKDHSLKPRIYHYIKNFEFIMKNSRLFNIRNDLDHWW